MGLFQKLLGGRRDDDAAPRLDLGAFGKHPGRKDHLDIAAGAGELAKIHLALYREGIRHQIDTQAWENLEPEKRLAGFDHSFLWLRPPHVFLGLLWSSTDAIGRAEYPMVVCIDGQKVSPGFMLAKLLPGLERLRSACQQTTSAEEVERNCRDGQQQLTGVLSRASAAEIQGTPAVDARRRFLERPELGPDRLGLLRAFHEVNSSLAGMGASNRQRATHLRLPLASESSSEALGLWSVFLRCIVAEPIPVLLIVRAGVRWFDALVGEPGPEDFFCLQTSPKAMPLVTEIPYQLPADLNQKLAVVEAAFLPAGGAGGKVGQPAGPATSRTTAPNTSGLA